MFFPSPGWRHPIRCFWVAVWNWGELTGQTLGISSPWLFGKCLDGKGMQVCPECHVEPPFRNGRCFKCRGESMQ